MPPFLISICLMAMSSDFFEILLPKPVPLSEVDIFIGFLVNDSGKCEVFRASNVSNTFPLVWGRPLPGGSASLPLLTIGDDCLLVILPEFVFSTCPFTVMAAPGLDLPAERGLSGKVVLRFGGVSCGKSWRTMGCGGGRMRETGELGLDMRPFEGKARPPDGKDGTREGAGVLRVGVDGLEDGRIVGEVKLEVVCGRGVGVDGLEFWDGLMVLSMEVVVGDGRVLEGVVAREIVEREDVVEGLDVDEERLVGVDGLM